MKKLNIKQLKDQKDIAIDRVNDALSVLSEESMKVLRDLGVKSKDPSWRISDLQEMVADILHHNQNPKTFINNLDIATYETRQSLRWNGRMLFALTKQQINGQLRKRLGKNAA